MKASISAWSYRSLMQGEGAEMDLLSFLDEVKRQGADGFEIFPAYVDAARPAEHLKEVMAKAKTLGLDVSTLIAGNDFARAKAAERAEQVDEMKAWIEAAAAAGIPRMNVFTGYHQPGQDPTMETMRVIDSYREVMPLAEEKGITLCIENHSSVHPDADGLLAIIRAVGSDRLR
ncbi:MAG: sugar phosphate isomerase/epimerase family protein, partial [Planctomycetota bacterium]